MIHEHKDLSRITKNQKTFSNVLRGLQERDWLKHWEFSPEELQKFKRYLQGTIEEYRKNLSDIENEYEHLEDAR